MKSTINKDLTSYQPSFANINKISALSIMNVDAFQTTPVSTKQIIPELMHLRNLANAIYFLEDTKNNVDNIASLTKECSKILKKISSMLVNLDDKLSASLRASYIDSNFNNKELLINITKLIEKELVLILGPMTTVWANRHRNERFSYVAAIPRNELKLNVDAHYNDLEKITRLLQNIINENELYLSSVPKCIIADIIFSGGAADALPRHFAYFLPEDEGKKYSGIKKTIVFSNLYLHRFLNTTVSIGNKFINSFNVNEAQPFQYLNLLLLWIRGHDIGHFIRLPATNFSVLRQHHHFYSMTLQEVLADCVGYILLYFANKSVITPINHQNSHNIILAEMLRYFLKDSQETPDSYAALIELNFLITHGFVKIINNQLYSTPDMLYNGLVDLATLTSSAVLKSNIDKAQALINKYGNNHIINPKLKDFLNTVEKNAVNFALGEYLTFNGNL